MAKFNTLEELHAAAMLLGMMYDPTDHTYNKLVGTEWVSYEPETMKLLYTNAGDDYLDRCRSVDARKLGIHDTQMENTNVRRR